MNTLDRLLGASARFALLRAMYYQTAPVSLRQWARLADVHPHSVELVVSELLKEQIINIQRNGVRTWFSKNSDHPSWHIIANVCDGADRALRQVRRPRLDRAAKTCLAFIDESERMLKRARRSIHAV